MLRMIGCIGILSGAIGLVWDWRRQEKRRICQLEELERFLQKGIFAIEKELKQSRNFFLDYKERETKDVLLQKVLQEIIDNLDSNTFSSGNRAWEAAWESNKRVWKPNEEEWKIILSMGEAFFGRDRKEMAQQMHGYEQRIKELERYARNKINEKWKIYMPLGISGGFLIILLLI